MNVNPAIVSIKAEAINTLKYESERAPVTKEIKYINSLGVDVIVLDRKGIEIKVPKRFNPGRRELAFRIVEQYTLTEEVTINFTDDENDPDIERYRDCILESLQMDSKAQRNTRKSIIETVITQTTLNDYNNAIYVKEHDIVIYIPKLGVNVLHPTTVSKILNGVSLVKRDMNQFNFSIKINDPRNKIGNRYINISGVVYEIIPDRDPTIFEGVMVTSTGENGELCNIPMSLEEFEEKIRSYKTFEEATTLGNMEEQVKASLVKELDQLKHQNAITAEQMKTETLKHQKESDDVKHMLTKAQSELKHQETQHKKEIELLNSQIDREKADLEFKSLQRKAYYEERSYDRKDSSELIKFLPMIIGAGLVLLFK